MLSWQPRRTAKKNTHAQEEDETVCFLLRAADCLSPPGNRFVRILRKAGTQTIDSLTTAVPSCCTRAPFVCLPLQTRRAWEANRRWEPRAAPEWASIQGGPRP